MKNSFLPDTDLSKRAANTAALDYGADNPAEARNRKTAGVVDPNAEAAAVAAVHLEDPAEVAVGRDKHRRVRLKLRTVAAVDMTMGHWRWATRGPCRWAVRSRRLAIAAAAANSDGEEDSCWDNCAVVAVDRADPAASGIDRDSCSGDIRLKRNMRMFSYF